MAGPVLGQDEQQLKRRAMRRLAIALTLIAAAIAALALLDRYNAAQKKPEIPAAAPPGSQGLPLPGERPPAAQGPPLSPPQLPAPSLPPPPPPVVSNESEVPREAPRATPRANKPAEEPVAGEHRQEAAPAPLQPPAITPPKSAEVPAAAKGAAPKAPLPPESTASKGYLVQVGVFTTPEHASRLQAKLAEKNIPSFVETRVVVGPFQDRAEADAVNKQLKEMGLQGVVVAPH